MIHRRVYIGAVRVRGCGFEADGLRVERVLPRVEFDARKIGWLC